MYCLEYSGLRLTLNNLFGPRQPQCCGPKPGPASAPADGLLKFGTKTEIKTTVMFASLSSRLLYRVVKRKEPRGLSMRDQVKWYRMGRNPAGSLPRLPITSRIWEEAVSLGLLKLDLDFDKHLGYGGAAQCLKILSNRGWRPGMKDTRLAVRYAHSNLPMIKRSLEAKKSKKIGKCADATVLPPWIRSSSIGNILENAFCS